MSTLKKLFTGYFAAGKKYPPDQLQIRIASTAPAWWGAKRKSYQPKLVWRAFRAWKAGVFTGDGKADYFEQMDLMRASGELQKILDEMPDKSILLCYEGDVCTCHRGWLSEYIRLHNLAEISEFPIERADEKRKLTCKRNDGQTNLLI